MGVAGINMHGRREKQKGPFQSRDAVPMASTKTRSGGFAALKPERRENHEQS